MQNKEMDFKVLLSIISFSIELQSTLSLAWEYTAKINKLQRKKNQLNFK